MIQHSGRLRHIRRGGIAAGLSVLTWFAAQPAAAVVIELKDVASDRVERQRAEAIGQLPLPGTPNVGQLAERLAAKQMAMGNPILIRVFKASSELELWMKSGEGYSLFATYPICNWSGTLGPKLLEGDKQSPEGVYTVTASQLHLVGRHPRSLNLGFPNALDRQMNRTGSYILIHGGCSSVGCFAMTNPVIEEVYSLALAAVKAGKQDAFQVQVFPFRMTEERLRAYASNEWYDFWRNLKDVSDSFERTRQPPQITICEGRYWVEDATESGEVAAHGPLAVCAASLAGAALQRDQDDVIQQVLQPWWPRRVMIHPALVRSKPAAPMLHSPMDPAADRPLVWQPANQPAVVLSSLLSGPQRPNSAMPRGSNSQAPPQTALLAMTMLARTGRFATAPGVASPTDLGVRQIALQQRLEMPCSQIRASCRHWLSTQISSGRWPPKNRRFEISQSRAGRAAPRQL